MKFSLHAEYTESERLFDELSLATSILFYTIALFIFMPYHSPCHSPQWLTGHPKGAAAAWMVNGMLQCLSTGLIPGNRNIDDVDPAFRRFDRLFYPNESIQTSYVKAALVKSFGCFGITRSSCIGQVIGQGEWFLPAFRSFLSL